MILRTLIRLSLALAVVITTLVAIGLVLAQSPLAPTDAYTYPGSAPCETTLQACIDGLQDGDVIHILPGEYTASLTLNKAVSLIGSHPLTPTVLRAPIGQRVLSITGATINNSVVISGLQITGGDVSAGGGGILISDGAWPTLNNVTISGNRANNGGGIYINQTGQAAGPVMIVHSQIVNNHAVDSGGGLYLSLGQVLLAGRGSIADNTAVNLGGGVYIDRGTFTLQNGQIDGNRAVTANGGGLYLNNPTAIYTQITGTLAHNMAAGSGGGLYAVNNTVQLYGGVVFSNTASGNGGGLYLDKGSLTLNGPVGVVDNHAQDGGGLYLNTGTAQLAGGQLVGNGASGNGGGLYAGNTITISATRFLANSAGNTGGGLYAAGSGEASLANSLFARNNAGQAAAGLSLNSSGTATLRHLTVVDPGSNAFEAIVVTGGTADIKNTSMTSHTIGLSRTAGTLTADYNLYFGNVVTQSGAILPGSHDVVGFDPLFVDPAAGSDNYRLQLFSPAVDAGVDAGIYTDLGGQPRPIGHGFDIGAFELQADVVNIGPTVGGTLNYTSTTGTTTTVILPPGLVSTPTLIVFNNVSTETTTIPPLPPGLALSGDVFELNAFVNNTQVQDITFTLPVTIIFRDAEAGGTALLNSTLKLYRYEHPPYGDDWCAVGECRSGEAQWLDIHNRTLTANVLGFSRFGHFGANSQHAVFLPLISQGH
ncbi:putative outer membrane protein pmp20 [Thermoflexales bacterium]|nr:putative outer membrane protein pmp20 [Thermoflexales bacterium]